MNRIASRLLAGPSIRPRRVAAVSAVSTQWVQSRNVHNALELPYDVEGGLGEFLPPAALKTVAVEYQQGLLDRLNNEVASKSHIIIPPIHVLEFKSFPQRHTAKKQKRRPNSH